MVASSSELEKSQRSPELTSIQKAIETEVKDPQKANQLFTKITAIYKRHTGPLPSPECLKEYANIIPGLGERIVKMAEKQSDHRIEIESIVINSQTSESRRGQSLAFFIAIFALLLAGFLAIMGHETTASVIGSIDIVGLVSIFIVGKVVQRSNLEKKS